MKELVLFVSSGASLQQKSGCDEMPILFSPSPSPPPFPPNASLLAAQEYSGHYGLVTSVDANPR